MNEQDWTDNLMNHAVQQKDIAEFDLRKFEEIEMQLNPKQDKTFYHEGFADGFELAESKFRKGYARYEKLRKLNADQFTKLFQEHLKLQGAKTFDEMVDEL
ncbi:MAG: hypothetical protein V4629_02940 [Pseudomonadota bacterium]